MTDAIQVFTTTPSEADARKIAETLLASRLAACVQIGGSMQSFYRWQGVLESATEWLCTIKTERRLFAEVERVIGQLHPYAEPEILAVAVVAGSSGYLRWLSDAVKEQ